MTEWISVRKAAELAKYHQERIRELAREGKINSKKFATVWQIDESSLKDYLARMQRMGKKRGPKNRKDIL